jgi:hypothetical protein
VSLHHALPGLFSFGSAPTRQALEDDAPTLTFGGEAGAVRVLYQNAPQGSSRSSRGKAVLDWLKRLLDSIVPDVPIETRVPIPVRVRR